MRTSFRVRAAIALALGCVLVASRAMAADSPTLKNLQTAYNGESNAHARYLAFAKKADGEGYGKVASLFRAAARAESIHASNHAQVIRKMGGKPTAKIEKPVVKSTAQNLQTAIKGETYERDKMYPDFLKQARKERNREAIRTFTFARHAEGDHAGLYTLASRNLQAWKVARATFYVCPECGRTVTRLDREKCPVCYTPEKKYLAVS